jgi:hypothetical protein
LLVQSEAKNGHANAVAIKIAITDSAINEGFGEGVLLMILLF